MKASRVCDCCGTFPGEVSTPIVDNDGEAFTCWLCAHVLTVHEAPLAELRARIYSPDLGIAGHAAYCSCSGVDVYPPGTETGDRLRREQAQLRAAVKKVERDVARGNYIAGLVRGAGEVRKYSDPYPRYPKQPE